jgi:glutamate synthase domain-containing protein 3
VLIGNLPSARVTDPVQDLMGVDSIAEGSETVLIGNLYAARIGDATAAGGVIVEGDETVWIGDASGVGNCLATAAAQGSACISGMPSDTVVA